MNFAQESKIKKSYTKFAERVLFWIVENESNVGWLYEGLNEWGILTTFTDFPIVDIICLTEKGSLMLEIVDTCIASWGIKVLFLNSPDE